MGSMMIGLTQLALTGNTGGNTPAPAYITIPSYATMNVMGDSFTTGSQASPGTNGFAYLLATALGATLTMKGVSGSVLQNSADASASPRADNGRDRFSLASTAANGGILGSNRKDALFIALGFNDARYIGAPGTFNVAGYLNDYREMMNGILADGGAPDQIYVASPWYITDTGLNTYGSDPNFAGQTRSGFEAFVAAARSVATEFGVQYTDMYAALNTATFIANVGASDNIHPTNAGHAEIRDAWINRTERPNTRNRPASVSSTGGAGEIVATCSAVTGATSYEFVPINGYADGATTTSASPTSVTIPSLAAGNYRVKARAVFSGGVKGPWAFATSDATVTAAGGTIFLRAEFAGALDTLITAYTPDVGGAFVAVPSVSGNSQPFLTGNGRIYNRGTASVFYNNAAPGTADYYCEATFDFLSAVASETIGVGVRASSAAHTLYFARWSGGNWQLFKTVTGSSIQLGSNYADAFTSGSRTLRLQAQGSSLKVFLDGVEIISATDTDITAAGFASTRGSAAQTATTGRQMTRLEASTL